MLLNLYDAFGKETNGAICEWGLSILAEFQGKKILFDAGSSPVIFKKNAKAFSVDLTKIDIGILSHDHWDHSCGFHHVVEVNPNIHLFMPDDISLGGEEFQKHKKKWRIGYRYPNITTDLIEKSAQISKGVHLIATQSNLTGTFSKYPPSKNFPEEAFKGIPEISLALEDKDGSITLLVGCSHSGIENILQTTKKYFKKNIDRIVGGLHLLPYDKKYIGQLISEMKNRYGVHSVHASHCTGDLAQKLLKEAFKSNYSAFGLGAKLEL